MTELHAAHARFVWRSLSRLGVKDDDLPDQLQEVFLVVHRRLHTFRPDQAQATTWLFGICARVASSYRKKLRRRREETVSDVPDRKSHAQSPEEQLALRQAAHRLDEILDKMNGAQRAVFVMFEVEGLDCPEIAEQMGTPIGTVYSRLHAARTLFARAVERNNKRGKVRE